MSRRLVLTLITGSLLAGGLSASALAATAPAARHNLCVGDPTTNTGWCVVVDDPSTTLSGILPPR